MQSSTETIPAEAPARLPMRAKAIVTRWVGARGYGFLDAKPRETQIIFVHANILPVRFGIGKHLIPGEPVVVSYHKLEDGRLRATHIEFADSKTPQ